MDYIKIGVITKPQGIKGEVKVDPYTDDVYRFLDLKYAFFKSSNTYEKVKVMGARSDGKNAFLLFERIYDRNAAEALRGKEIFVDRENAVKLPEGRYFIVDLLGSKVLDENGNQLGILKEVLQPGANDVFVVKTDGEDLLIPVVDAFVSDIDPKNKEIRVNGSMLVEEEIRDN